jgi:hypothetical protein
VLSVRGQQLLAQASAWAGLSGGIEPFLIGRPTVSVRVKGTICSATEGHIEWDMQRQHPPSPHPPTTTTTATTTLIPYSFSLHIRGPQALEEAFTRLCLYATGTELFAPDVGSGQFGASATAAGGGGGKGKGQGSLKAAPAAAVGAALEPGAGADELCASLERHALRTTGKCLVSQGGLREGEQSCMRH